MRTQLPGTFYAFDYVAFGHSLTELIFEKRLKLGVISGLCDINPAYLVQLMDGDGRQPISVDQLAALCALLEISPNSGAYWTVQKRAE